MARSVPPMRDKLTPKGQARRDDLLRTSARLFADRGYHPTSVSDIVDEMGVGKGVFYWYFASKEELLSELLRSSNRSLRRRQQSAISEATDPLTRIELGIRASLQWFQEHREHFAIIQFAAADEIFSPVLASNEDVAIADTARHIKEASVEGVVVDLDPDMLAHAIHGVVGRLARDFLIERNEPIDLVADLAVAFTLQGLQPRDAAQGPTRPMPRTRTVALPSAHNGSPASP